jgi:regulator of protease activity HflC (stomatin/prohibitin superfamily)
MSDFRGKGMLQPQGGGPARRLPLLGGIGIIVIVVAILLFGAWYTVDQGMRGVILRNGAVIGVAEPGWGFKMPIIDRVVQLSVRTEKASYKDVQSYSKDIQAADLLLSVNYRIDAGRVAEIYSDLGPGYVDSILTPAVLNAVKIVFGRYIAVSIVGERGKLTADMVEAIRSAVLDRGIIVESVQLENVDFSSAYEQSIEARMQAEVEVARYQQNLAREKIEADIARTKALGAADAVRAAAQAEADAIRLRGDAEAAAIRARGDALKDNPNIIELTQAERWNGALPTTMVPEATLPFLSIPRSR